MPPNAMVHDRRAVLLLLVLSILLLTMPAFAEQIQAAQTPDGVPSMFLEAHSPDPPSTATATFAFSLDGILGDRTRMIQVTIVVVAIGIGLLMWGKS